MLKSISETIDGYIEGAVAKTKNPLWKFILLGIMAGFFIGAGAAISNVAMHSIPSVGVARLVAACQSGHKPEQREKAQSQIAHEQDGGKGYLVV